MPPVITDAIVLHAFDYLETSRILRLVTRDAGVHSVLAKGARRSRAKYGSAVDLFAEGEAQIYLKTTRDLHTLASFDVTVAHTGLSLDFSRFLAASALSELVLRLGRDDASSMLYHVVRDTLHTLSLAEGLEIPTLALAGAWRIVAVCGFSPALDHCASCHKQLDPAGRVAFSYPAGGAICSRCAPRMAAGRQLPAEARLSLRQWIEGDMPAPLSIPQIKAHQRLFREFLREHVAEDRPMPAFSAWENQLDL